MYTMEDIKKFRELVSSRGGTSQIVPEGECECGGGSSSSNSVVINGCELIMDVYNTLDNYYFRTFINSEVTRRWNRFPTPPNHMDGASIVILLLSSKNYTFNPFTFPWEHVYHEFYISMWKILCIRVKIDKKYTS